MRLWQPGYYSMKLSGNGISANWFSCKNRLGYAIICMNRKESIPGKVGVILSPAEWFWKIFEVTGSPNAYLLYRKYTNQ
jgi:hypothetical protein